MSEKHEGHDGRRAEPHGDTHDDTHAENHGGAHGPPGGLAVSAGGYTLQASPTVLDPGRQEDFELRVLDADGREVRDLEEQHGERMHLIVVPRDLSGYQHLHPSLVEDGRWSIPLALPVAGAYRAFADFAVGGVPLTLGVDLFAPGDFRPQPLPGPAPTAGADGGYQVALEVGVLAPGAGATLNFRVSREGRPVEDLEPYLGASGHLVALREGDLAYLHVHPEDEAGSGPEVAFHAAFPSAGRYRLFLQFAHEGRVRTTAFTLHVPSRP